MSSKNGKLRIVGWVFAASVSAPPVANLAWAGHPAAAPAGLLPKSALTAAPPILEVVAVPEAVGELEDEYIDEETLLFAGPGGSADLYDISPCGGDGQVEVGDILAMLAAYAGNYSCSCPATTAWSLSGNAGTDPVTNYIGTSDNRAVNFRANNQRVLRLEPEGDSSGRIAPNVVAGWKGNSVSPGVVGATIGGGGGLSFAWPFPNSVTANFATVSGGWDNSADGWGATVGGGYSNHATADAASIGGGASNEATAQYSTVGGGTANRATGISATVPGGSNNLAAGTASMAAGYFARANHAGTFVWGDASVFSSFDSTAVNQFLIRADGGVGINTNNPGAHELAVVGNGSLTAGSTLYVQNTNVIGVAAHVVNSSTASTLIVENGSSGDLIQAYSPTLGPLLPIFQLRSSGRLGLHRSAAPDHPLHIGTSATTGNGAHLTGGGTWTNGSSREFKDNFEEIDKRELLRRVVELPVTRWQYQGEEDSVRHIGPVAEDFRAAFSLGHDDRYITTIDADGVALAAIQGLHEIVREKDCELEELKARNAELEARLARIERLLIPADGIARPKN